MSADENKAIARRFIEEVWNNRNPDAIDELAAPDFVDHTATPPFGPDREGAKQFTQAYLAAFPDVHFAIEDIVAEGDRVVVRWTGRGTHRGELLGIPPTGKTVTVTGININHMAGGKVVEGWSSWDRLSFMQQLGLIPAPEQAQAAGA